MDKAMNDADVTPPPVTASTRRSRRIPAIWAIPLLAVAVGLWLAWDTYAKRGPTITIAFATAEGLKEGQSQLKFKDIILGTVQSLDLTENHAQVLVKIATTRQATSLLTRDTYFWVAKPRLFAGNISGLDTVLSGSYVAMLPSAVAGPVERDFVGHEDPPVLTADIPGRTYVLRSKGLGSISLGAPIFFHELSVGQVLGWEMANDAENFTIRAFVRSPYDQYVHEETRFWDASGLAVKLGSSGVELQMESLRALLLGGLAFDTPAGVQSPVAQQDHTFPLYPDHEAANAASYRRKVPLLSYFSGSVRGLGPGSDVTIHGLKVGQVTDVRLIFDPAKDAVLAPVSFDVDPERVLGVGHRAFDTPRQGVEALVRAGWRASLESANLITGQQVVALDVVPDAAPATVTVTDEHFVMPAVENGGFSTLTSSASDLLKRVNEIPFKQIGDRLNNVLLAADDTANGPQVKQALTDLAGTLDRTKALIDHLDNAATPTLRQLPQLTAELQKTLSGFNGLAASMNSAYGDNTKFNRDVDRSLAQLNDALRSIRALADLLARHPEALIKGRAGGGTE
jgi:paraquat-inducible protein B